jgi:hypothetical protein
MKKNHSPFDDVWTFAAPDAGSGAPVSAHEGTNETLVIDEGEPFPLAADVVGSITTTAGKPVASIATLADYLVNGFWQYNSALAHHWASNTVTYNISALNSAEQFLALSAMQAWHDVANVNFVQTSGSAIRARTMAACRIRPTRSMPTTPGNIPSCHISRSRIIPGVRTATWSRRRWRTSTPSARSTGRRRRREPAIPSMASTAMPARSSISATTLRRRR